jgi:chemotaxis protein MotB
VNGGQTVVVSRRRRAARRPTARHVAWKVAYADFITALMAVFLVLWLGTQETAVRTAVAAYFRDPGVFDHTTTNGVLQAVTNRPAVAERPMPGDTQFFEGAAERIRAALAALPGPTALTDQIEMKTTDTALSIELVDSANAVFFATGSAVLSPEAERLLLALAGELALVDVPIVFAGHTDARPYSVTDRYSNWELSADRANAARRVMERGGLPPSRVEDVRGYADTELKVPGRPFDARNRRVAILVRPHPEPAETGKKK